MPEHRVCPWWLGYLLASPLRRLLENPARVVEPYVREGMTVLEPGPGMGFFTLELARRAGVSGRVIAVDIQEKMLAGLMRRAKRAGLAARITARLAQPDSLSIGDLAGTVDFVLAYAMVHEMPDAASFFRQAAEAMKTGALLLLAEPAGHVDQAHFDQELTLAAKAGLTVDRRPELRRSLSALLRKA